jgi:hypothetical protein
MYAHFARAADLEKGNVVTGDRVEDLLLHIDRLYVAKQRLDQRIAQLGGGRDVDVRVDSLLILTL